MSDQPQRKGSLREIELEVEAEGREWMGQRLEEKPEKEADRDGAVFPPQPKEGATPTRQGAATKDRRGGR